MKYLKYLMIAFVVTCITSVFGVYANVDDPYQIRNVEVENYGSVRYTSGYLKEQAGTGQQIKNIQVRPTNDFIYVKVIDDFMKDCSKTYTMKTGGNIQISDPAAMIDKYYSLQFNSPWYYTRSTYIDGDWYIR